jgi:hypothetical protein
LKGKIKYCGPNELYQGEWKNGKKNGEGELTFKNHPKNIEKMTGTWLNGEFKNGDVIYSN